MLKNVIFKIKRENVKTPNKVRNVNVNLKSDPDLHRAALKGSVYRLLYLWRCLVCADSRRKAGTKKKKNLLRAKTELRIQPFSSSSDFIRDHLHVRRRCRAVHINYCCSLPDPVRLLGILCSQ